MNSNPHVTTESLQRTRIIVGISVSVIVGLLAIVLTSYSLKLIKQSNQLVVDAEKKLNDTSLSGVVHQMLGKKK